MKTFDAQKYVQLAVSKDRTRETITGVYRDKTALVATDGHRLHYLPDMPEVSQGSYLDGRDSQFPDWRQVLPNTPLLGQVQLMGLEAATLKRALKAMCCFELSMASHVKISFEPVKENDYLAHFKFKHEFSEVYHCAPCGTSTDIGAAKSWEHNINPRYLYDAITDDEISIELNYYGEYLPMMVVNLRNKVKALIMPVRTK